MPANVTDSDHMVRIIRDPEAAGAFMTNPDSLNNTYQFTSKLEHDVYPSIDPTNLALSQEGKVVLITGAGRGIGRVRLNSTMGGPQLTFWVHLTVRCPRFRKSQSQGYHHHCSHIGPA